MATDATPAHSELPVNIDVLECCAAVWAGKRPGYFPHAACGLDRLDAKVCRPLRTIGAAGRDMLRVRRVDFADSVYREGLFVRL
jgi:hypothetical protein